MLTKAQEKLIITYQVLNDEGKKNELPAYIVSLNDIFDTYPIKVSEQFDFDLSGGNRFALGNRKIFERDFSNLLNEECLEKLKVKKQSHNNLNKKKIDANGKEVFFADGKVKVTQIEQYFSCPFKHFARYGLKLKEKETCQFEVKDVGNVCHRGAELFVKKLIFQYQSIFDASTVVFFLKKSEKLCLRV